MLPLVNGTDRAQVIFYLHKCKSDVSRFCILLAAAGPRQQDTTGAAAAEPAGDGGSSKRVAARADKVSAQRANGGGGDGPNSPSLPPLFSLTLFPSPFLPLPIFPSLPPPPTPPLRLPLSLFTASLSPSPLCLPRGRVPGHLQEGVRHAGCSY
jgi:hypothetical protein